MRKVVAALFVSLDGVVESPDRWQFDNFDEDMLEAMTSQLSQQDAVLLGRATYQEWADYWPTSTHEPFATFINNTQKYVFSTTLASVNWANSTLVKGDLADEIAALKARRGGIIGTAGSPGLVRSLLQQDLLDELLLMVHPVVVGQGKRLFDGGDAPKRLHLVESRATRTGVALLTYRPLDRS
jgi:dihydrofolate reductase